MNKEDEKLLQLAFEVIGVKTKTALAKALNYSKTEPNNWRRGFSNANKSRIKKAIEEVFNKKNISSNDLLHRRYLEIFVPLDINVDNNTNSNIIIGSGNININTNDFNHSKDIEKLVSLLKYAPSEFINNVINKLEDFKENSKI